MSSNLSTLAITKKVVVALLFCAEEVSLWLDATNDTVTRVVSVKLPEYHWVSQFYWKFDIPTVLQSLSHRD